LFVVGCVASSIGSLSAVQEWELQIQATLKKNISKPQRLEEFRGIVQAGLEKKKVEPVALIDCALACDGPDYVELLFNILPDDAFTDHFTSLCRRTMPLVTKIGLEKVKQIHLKMRRDKIFKGEVTATDLWLLNGEGKGYIDEEVEKDKKGKMNDEELMVFQVIKGARAFLARLSRRHFADLVLILANPSRSPDFYSFVVSAASLLKED